MHTSASPARPPRGLSNAHFDREKAALGGLPVDNLWGQPVEKISDLLVILLLRDGVVMGDRCAREVRGTPARGQHRL
jgi:hypothetical protein